jgi:protein SCO1/2
MQARHWIIMATAGIAGFAVAALAIVFAVGARQSGHIGIASIGGPFMLVDDSGAQVSDKTLAGKPYAIYFGYTYCPEVCPTTLLDLSRWIKKLGPDADKLNYVFVTVDPERDTPRLMHSYLSSFDKHIRGFTGTPVQIAKIAGEYRVYYKKIPTSAGGYVMDHSSMIYLMDADQKFDTIIAYQENDASAVSKLKSLSSQLPTSQKQSGNHEPPIAAARLSYDQRRR